MCTWATASKHDGDANADAESRNTEFRREPKETFAVMVEEIKAATGSTTLRDGGGHQSYETERSVRLKFTQGDANAPLDANTQVREVRLKVSPKPGETF